jgi:hypothetical protein
MLKHKVLQSTMMLAMVYPRKAFGFPRSGFMILTKMGLMRLSFSARARDRGTVLST